VCGGLALISGFVDGAAVLRMFVPWHSHPHPPMEAPPSPKGTPPPAAPPRVHWELFRLFNWLTSVTFLFCVAHLASVQRSGLSILFHSRVVVLVCCLCLVRMVPFASWPKVAVVPGRPGPTAWRPPSRGPITLFTGREGW
jgi:hypothetical protein